jgi:hypothetical protein
VPVSHSTTADTVYELTKDVDEHFPSLAKSTQRIAPTIDVPIRS